MIGLNDMSKKSWIAIAIVAALQTAVLLYMVLGRVSLLASGREIVAEVVPVDPRDLFRGDYVVFGYPFSRTGDLSVPEKTRVGDALYVTLKPGAEPDKWDIASVAARYPDQTDAANVVLKGLVTSVYAGTEPNSSKAGIRYGIESYFVPEGKGRDLEQLVRDKKLAAVLAVGRKGDAAIKALMIDGKRVVEEPLF